jgi:hypothetical protein
MLYNQILYFIKLVFSSDVTSCSFVNIIHVSEKLASSSLKRKDMTDIVSYFFH